MQTLNFHGCEISVIQNVPPTVVSLHLDFNAIRKVRGNGNSIDIGIDLLIQYFLENRGY